MKVWPPRWRNVKATNIGRPRISPNRDKALFRLRVLQVRRHSQVRQQGRFDFGDPNTVLAAFFPIAVVPIETVNLAVYHGI